MLLGGRQTLDRMMPARTSNLGRVWGPVANIVSCLFVLEGSIIYCFPATLVSGRKTCASKLRGSL